jgi:hypothetical protein
MSQENSEPSLKDLLMVPDGPPDAVWLRALETALSEVESDALDDALTQPYSEDGDSFVDPGAFLPEAGSTAPGLEEDPVEGETGHTAGAEGDARSWDSESDDGYGT